MTQFRIRPFLAASIAAAMLATSLTAAADPQSPEARYVKGDAVNVRGGPGTGNSVLEVLFLGTEVQIYLTTGDWSRISPPGQPEKWIYAPLLQREKPAAKAKVTGKPQNQQAAPDTKPAQKTDKDQPQGTGQVQDKDKPQAQVQTQDKPQTQDKSKTPDQHGDQPDHQKDQAGPRR